MNHLIRFRTPVILLTFALFYSTAQGQEGCRQPCLDLFVPNVITPNGDGKNDFFTITFDRQTCPCGLSEVSVVIYNRWGKEVFSFFSPTYQARDLKWDGDANGKDVSESAYYYRADLLDGNAEQRTFKGWVKVIREADI